eukprot:scaffold115845_cov58-Phaeocystis_antarctica.AAC.2
MMSCSWAGEVSRGTSSCGPLRSPVLVSNCAITAPVGAASPAAAELLPAWRGAAASGGARMFPGGAIGLPRCGLGFFEGGKASPIASPSRCEFLCRLVPPGACGIAVACVSLPGVAWTGAEGSADPRGVRLEISCERRYRKVI